MPYPWEQPQPRLFGPFNSRVTYYAPGPGDRMEGGFETSRPNPQTGKRVPSTLDDVRLGTSPFVTLAGDPSRYGQTVKMGPLTYTSPIDRKSYTLPDVTGYVHDTGSAFRGRPDKLDVAAGDYRGYSPQAASAAVQADAGRRPVTPLTGDEADQAMRPIGLPEPWRATGAGENPTETAMASGPPQQGRKMPDSLADMFQPTDPMGKPTGWNDAIAQRSNSLIGLGLGLLSPIQPGSGQTGFTQGLRGLMAGSQADTRTAEHRQQLARQAAQDKLHQSNWERQFARGDITDAQRAMRDVLGDNATPEQKADFMRNYYASKTDPGGWILKDIIDPSDPDGERKITVQEHNRTGQIRPPQLPGQTGTTAAPATNWTPGASNAPVYGQQGNYTPGAGAAAAPAAAPARGITLPNGEVVTPPPGLSKKSREAWANDVAKTAADMQTGKMTEAQAKYSIYATGMVHAHRELQGLEGEGTSPGTSAEGKGLGRLPWGVGAFFQSNEYQNYRNAKDAWLNAKLRAESGATINPDEFARDDRIYFPQPGEGPEQVAAKKKLREHITNMMTRASGPGYTAPPALAPPQAGGGNAPPPPASARQTGGAVRWGRDAQGNPVPVP